MHVHESDCPLTRHRSTLLPDMQIQRDLAVSGRKKSLMINGADAFTAAIRGLRRNASVIPGRHDPQEATAILFSITSSWHSRNGENRTGITETKKSRSALSARPGTSKLGTDQLGVGCSTPGESAQGGPLRTKRMRYTDDGGELASSKRIVVSGVAMLTVVAVTTVLDQASAPFFKAIGVHVTMS